MNFNKYLEQTYLNAKFRIFTLRNKTKKNWLLTFNLAILKSYLKFLQFFILLFKKNDDGFKILKEDLYEEFCNTIENLKIKKKFSFSKIFLKTIFSILKKFQNNFDLLKGDMYASLNEVLDKMEDYNSDGKLNQVKATIGKIKNKNQVDENSLLELEKELFEYNKYKKKKATILSLSTISTLVIAVICITFVSTILFPQAMKIKAASYGFVQTDWSGGASTTAIALHNNNQSGWTYYYSKDGVSTTTNGQLSLDFTVADRKIETANADWQIHATTSTYYSNGSVGILKPNGATCSAAVECSSGYCYIDNDGDRYAPSSGTTACQSNSQLANTDCDDSNAAIYPGSSAGQVCSVCNNDGTITYQTAAQDLFNECTQGSTSADGCVSNTCSGTSYNCGIQSTGDGGCPVCGKCSDTDIACENQAAGSIDTGCALCKKCSGSEIGSCSSNAAIDTQPSGCNSSCQYCNGSGVCKTMHWQYISSTGGTQDCGIGMTACKPSTNPSYNYFTNSGSGVTGCSALCNSYSGSSPTVYYYRCASN